MSQKAWGGVFEVATDRRVEQFTESVSFDRRLYAQDIEGSTAHAQMLAKVGLLSSEELKAIEQTLGDIRREIEQGSFPFCTELEDIHMHVEKALVDRTGDVGRSCTRPAAAMIKFRPTFASGSVRQLTKLICAVGRAEGVGRPLREGCRCDPARLHPHAAAQPVLAPHYWLAYCEKFERDRQRLADCRRRTNCLTLGAAALAGTSLPIDRDDVAMRLGFEAVAANSLDASSDRDFVLEFVFCLAMIAEHLSTWAEEWILWSTVEFDFFKLPQTFCTGSSIMPQKINPDVLELIRGKTARVVGALQTLLVLVKGLPLAYNRDLQEDKPPLFDAFDTVRSSLELAAPLMAAAELKRASIAERLDRGHLDATALMEHLIRRGVPMRTAHSLVGRLVSKAGRDLRLSDLPLDDFRAGPAGSGRIGL